MLLFRVEIRSVYSLVYQIFWAISASASPEYKKYMRSGIQKFNTPPRG